ncbi:MAG: hypothetical protein ACOC10_05020 [Bacteroidota bacterium]
MLTKEFLIEQGIKEEDANDVLGKLGDKAQLLVTKKYANDGVNNAYSNIDRSVLTLTGLQKNNEEKTSDYISRALSHIKDSSGGDEKVQQLNQEIASLKEQIKTGKGDENLKKMLDTTIQERDQLKTKLESFDKTLEEKTKEWKEKYEQTSSEYQKFKLVSDLKKAIPNNFRKDLPKDYIDFKVNSLIEKVLADYDKIENENGEIVLKNTEKFDVVKAADYFTNNLKDSLEGRQMAGTGADGNGNTPPPSQLSLKEGMSNSEKYQAIKDFVVKQGLTVTSNEFKDKMKTLQIEHGLLKEPAAKE